METRQPGVGNVFVDLLRTKQTYATRENAVKALERVTAKIATGTKVPYVIATTADGRFAPVVISNGNLLLFAHHGITVVGGP